MQKIPPFTLSSMQGDETASVSVWVKLLPSGTLHVVNGTRRLMAQIQVHGSASALLMGSGETIRIEQREEKFYAVISNVEHEVQL